MAGLRARLALESARRASQNAFTSIESEGSSLRRRIEEYKGLIFAYAMFRNQNRAECWVTNSGYRRRDSSPSVSRTSAIVTAAQVTPWRRSRSRNAEWRPESLVFGNQSKGAFAAGVCECNLNMNRPLRERLLIGGQQEIRSRPFCDFWRRETLKFLNAHRRNLETSLVDPGFIARVRKKLALDQRQAAAICGADAFSRYENGTTKPPLALARLLPLLDRHATC